MNIFQKLFGAEQKKGVEWNEQQWTNWGQQEKTMEKMGLNQYKGWVYRAIKLISQEVATINLTLYKNGKETEDERVLRPFYNPNKMLTRTELISSTQAYLELLGSCYWYTPLTEQGKPVGIWILRPDLVQIVKSKDMENPIKGYVYTVNGNRIPFSEEEVIPFMEFNPKSPLAGYSTLQATGSAVDTDNETKNWNNKFFKNSARPDVILEYSGTMDEKKYRKTQAEWEAKHKGSGNSHKVAILSGGLKMQKWNYSQKEMDFIEQRKFSRDEIFTGFGVPKDLMTNENASLAGSKTALWHFLRFTINPKMQSLTDTLNNYYLERNWGKEYRFEYINPVPQDKEEQRNDLVAGHNKWITTNEAREAQGLDPIDKGDTIYVPFGLVPLGEELDFGYGEGVKEVKTKSEEAEEDDFEARGEAHHKDLIKRTEKTEEYIYRKIIEELEREEQEILSNLFTMEKSKSLTKASTKDLFEQEVALEKIISFLTEGEVANILESGTVAMGAVAPTKLFDIESERVKEFIENNVGLASKTVVNTTYKKLKTIMAKYDKAGIDETAEAIKDTFTGMKDYRAMRIARSETMRSANFANEEAWQQSNVVTGKQWYTAQDEMVCPMCAPLHGKIINLGKAFLRKGESQVGTDGKLYPVDYTNVEYGSRHSNCRCVLLPVMETEKEVSDRIIKKEIGEKVKSEVAKIKGDIKKEVVEEVGEVIKDL